MSAIRKLSASFSPCYLSCFLNSLPLTIKYAVSQEIGNYKVDRFLHEAACVEWAAAMLSLAVLIYNLYLYVILVKKHPSIESEASNVLHCHPEA